VTLTLAPTPLVAILRGVKPDEAEATAGAIVKAGFGAIEVPLNSPEPLASIARIALRFGERILVGAGTVLEPHEVDEVAEAGGRLVVAPNADRAVIERAAKLGLVMLPGVATMTEAFEALKAGASGLKLFPGEAIPPEVVRAWRSVLPKATPLFPVGGVTPERIGPYRRAGADGFGIGSALYKPGASIEAVAHAAQAFVKAWNEAG
jgi:2-dehydro-3-deoxyphosphogalactonate aldolase